MHRFLNLLLNIITFSLQGKHHLHQIVINRHKIDSIDGFNCTKIKGAQVNTSGTCVCTNGSTILSQKGGGLECYKNLEDQLQSKILIFPCLLMECTSAFYQTIKYIGSLLIGPFHWYIA